MCAFVCVCLCVCVCVYVRARTLHGSGKLCKPECYTGFVRNLYNIGPIDVSQNTILFQLKCLNLSLFYLSCSEPNVFRPTGSILCLRRSSNAWESKLCLWEMACWWQRTYYRRYFISYEMIILSGSRASSDQVKKVYLSHPDSSWILPFPAIAKGNTFLVYLIYWNICRSVTLARLM